MLLSHHSAFRIGVHRWSRYELRQKGDVYVSHSHAHEIRRGGTATRTTTTATRTTKGDRRGDGADVVHGGASESLDLRLGAGRVPTAMNNGITNALVGGIGHNRICVHQPA